MPTRRRRTTSMAALGADTMVGWRGQRHLRRRRPARRGGGSRGRRVPTRSQTVMAALSIELMANVENLTYTRRRCRPVRRHRQQPGNNVITGGDLADTLSGLGGNDTLQGGLGADTMIGGDGNDVYVVDDAGDVVTETTPMPRRRTSTASNPTSTTRSVPMSKISTSTAPPHQRHRQRAQQRHQRQRRQQPAVRRWRQRHAQRR